MPGKLFQILLSFLVIVLQLGAAKLSPRLAGRIQLLDFGFSTAALAALAMALGTISGILLAFLLVRPGSEDSARRKWEFRTALIVGVFPFIGVIANLLFSAFGSQVFPFSFLRPVSSAFAEWAFGSPAPSIWLGLVIGWMIRRQGRTVAPG
jgi:hypothetical protein